MKQLIYATANDTKFGTASKVCQQFDVILKQVLVNVPEIQAHDGETVARDKAGKIYDIVQKPLVISDDSWMIPGLNNFPGPFMKYINDWFSAEDWLHLTRDLTDRRIILRQVAVYQDKREQRLFVTDVEGVILPEIRGQHHFPHTAVISFDGGKTSAAESLNAFGSALVLAKRRTSWHKLCEWLTRT